MSCPLRATGQENGAFRGERAVSPQSPSAIDLRPRGLRYLVRGLVRYWITHTLRPPFGAACAVPIVEGSFRHAHCSPSALRVRHEAEVEAASAVREDGAASVDSVCAGGVVGAGAGAMVPGVDGAGAVEGFAGVAADGGVAGVVGAGIVCVVGGVVGRGVVGAVWANAIVAAAESATATAIPIILFIGHLWIGPAHRERGLDMKPAAHGRVPVPRMNCRPDSEICAGQPARASARSIIACSGAVSAVSRARGRSTSGMPFTA